MRREFRLRAPRIDLSLQAVERLTQRGVIAGERRREEGRRGPEEPGVRPRDEEGQPKAERRHLVAMRLREPRDQAVQA